MPVDISPIPAALITIAAMFALSDSYSRGHPYYIVAGTALFPIGTGLFLAATLSSSRYIVEQPIHISAVQTIYSGYLLWAVGMFVYFYALFIKDY